MFLFGLSTFSEKCRKRVRFDKHSFSIFDVQYLGTLMDDDAVAHDFGIYLDKRQIMLFNGYV